MNLKESKIYLLSLLLISVVSCGEYNDIVKTPDFKRIDVQITGKLATHEVETVKDLQLKLDNFRDDIHLQEEMKSMETQITGVTPGMYNITINGQVTTTLGETFMLNGTLVNYPIVKENENIVLDLRQIRLGDLIFTEIFYAGTPKNYFRDQFYQVYNNSEKTIYLDGIYFANLTPGKATSKLPQWPEEDEDNFCYAERVWRFPGSGTDYPLAPGEACVISQFAANHKLPNYNPNSPIDGSSSEFEFNMNNPKFPNQPAFDMEHVFYDGLVEMGRVPQYLTSVFGGAYVIFEVPKGQNYDPVNNKALQTKDLSASNSKIFAKIPVEYVLDAVECADNETMINAKRVPGRLDSGITWVGATYNMLGVTRKKVGERADGTPLYQDTNNSTEDFIRGVTPLFRRDGAKMPKWNHTLN